MDNLKEDARINALLANAGIALTADKPYPVTAIVAFKSIEPQQDHGGTDPGYEVHPRVCELTYTFDDTNPQAHMTDARYVVRFSDPLYCNLESDTDVEISIKTLKAPKPDQSAKDPIDWGDPINTLSLKQQILTDAINLYRTMLSWYDTEATPFFKHHERRTINLTIEDLDYPI